GPVPLQLTRFNSISDLSRFQLSKSMRRHGAKNADYRGGVTCLCDTQLLGACLHASECGGRSRPEAVRGMPDVSIAPPATGPQYCSARNLREVLCECVNLFSSNMLRSISVYDSIAIVQYVHRQCLSVSL